MMIAAKNDSLRFIDRRQDALSGPDCKRVRDSAGLTKQNLTDREGHNGRTEYQAQQASQQHIHLNAECDRSQAAIRLGHRRGIGIL